MALLQKRPITESVMPLYTLSATKTIVIIGLGNPEDEYAGTRHNIGFAAVDAFAVENEFDSWIHKKDLKCHITQKNLGQTRVFLVKPTTYMNNSGEAAQAIVGFYKLGADQVIAVYDELDIPFGQIRTRTGGSAAGHNGVKSLIQYLGEDFHRMRIGIGPKTPEQMESADFVLAKFSKDEQGRIKDLTRETTALLTEIIYGGQLLPETRSF
jgi:PTH1 family peptidyl-tRNA hydrolase